jgi:hypothetical protein
VQYAFVNAVNGADDYNDSNDDDDDDDNHNNTNDIKADNIKCSAKELSIVTAFFLMTESAQGRSLWPRGL